MTDVATKLTLNVRRYDRHGKGQGQATLTLSQPKPHGDTYVWVETAKTREIRFVIEPSQRDALARFFLADYGLPTPPEAKDD